MDVLKDRNIHQKRDRFVVVVKSGPCKSGERTLDGSLIQWLILRQRIIVWDWPATAETRNTIRVCFSSKLWHPLSSCPFLVLSIEYVLLIRPTDSFPAVSLDFWNMEGGEWRCSKQTGRIVLYRIMRLLAPLHHWDRTLGLTAVSKIGKIISIYGQSYRTLWGWRDIVMTQRDIESCEILRAGQNRSRASDGVQSTALVSKLND